MSDHKPQMLVLNIYRRRFNPEQPFTAYIETLHPVSGVKNEKIEIESYGLSTKTPFGKNDIPISDAYAKRLIDNRAFVPNRVYQLETGFDMEALQTAIVNLIPVDEDVKKFMSEALKV